MATTHYEILREKLHGMLNSTGFHCYEIPEKLRKLSL